MARDISLIIHRSEYVRLDARVNIYTSSISIDGDRRDRYGYRADLTDAAREKLLARIGETLLAHATEHFKAIQTTYMSKLFCTVRQQIADQWQACLRDVAELEARYSTP